MLAALRFAVKLSLVSDADDGLMRKMDSSVKRAPFIQSILQPTKLLTLQHAVDQLCLETYCIRSSSLCTLFCLSNLAPSHLTLVFVRSSVVFPSSVRLAA